MLVIKGIKENVQHCFFLLKSMHQSLTPPHLRTVCMLVKIMDCESSEIVNRPLCSAAKTDAASLSSPQGFLEKRM